MIFTPTKDQVRHFFCEARRKQRDRLPLDGAEVLAADVIALHPEYHALLDDPGLLAVFGFGAFAWAAAMGNTRWVRSAPS